MSKHLESLGVQFDRFSAVDGAKLVEMRNNTLIYKADPFTYDHKYKFKYDSKDSRGTFGCVMSHIKAICESTSTTVIMEDDVDIRPMSMPFVPDLDTVIANAPEDWQIIKLVNTRYAEPTSDVYTKFRYGVTNTKDWSTAMYVINEKGIDTIKKVTRNGTHIPSINGCDIAADNWVYETCKTYNSPVTLALPCTPTLTSSIHTTHDQLHCRFSNKMQTKLLKMVFPDNVVDDHYDAIVVLTVLLGVALGVSAVIALIRVPVTE